MTKIGVITYSTWGHLNTLADSVAKGLEESGVEVVRYNFPETLSEEIRTKMYAAPRTSHPDITPADLKELDGFLLGFPTRYGRAPAQVSTFFDSTGQLWATGALVGKFGGIFTSCAGQHGGHESTALTTIPFFAHHGIVYVPIGYAQPNLSNETTIVGGSAWGASCVSGGKGTLAVLDSDKEVAEYQGKSFGTLVNTFVKGKTALAATEETVTGTVAAKEVPVAATQAEKAEGYAVDAPATSTETPAVAPTATATPAAAKPAVAQEPKKSGGGFFAMCCGKADDLKD